MCQCPERGDLHFYSIIIGSVKLLERCVNALKGATSISTSIGNPNDRQWADGVNALKGATSISTRGTFISLIKQRNCVNALKGATSISTAPQLPWFVQQKYCVNALKGATSISTMTIQQQRFRKKLCQCPERGDLHFYTVNRKPLLQSVLVSMP